jgi:hypothetical protein
MQDEGAARGATCFCRRENWLSSSLFLAITAPPAHLRLEDPNPYKGNPPQAQVMCLMATRLDFTVQPASSHLALAL